MPMFELQHARTVIYSECKNLTDGDWKTLTTTLGLTEKSTPDQISAKLIGIPLVSEHTHFPVLRIVDGVPGYTMR